MRLVRFYLAISSLGFAIGCQSIPPPKGYGCVAFAEKKRLVCFDLEKDFDPQTGNPRKEAQPKFYPLRSLIDLNRWVVFDPYSFASLKGFLLKHKTRCEEMAGK